MHRKDPDLVVSYLGLRQAIGWTGLLMPIAVRVGAYLFEGIATTGSISAYYYTGMRDVFVGTLILVGALLACYRSPAWHDGVVATVAGLAAIGIGLFPMEPVFAQEIIAECPQVTEQCYLNAGILGYHFLFVSLFFGLGVYLVYFRFKAFTPSPPTPQKVVRNKVYRVCGVLMLLGIAGVGYLAFLRTGESIFWPETLAVGAFAIAWLVKGQTVLRDP